MGAVGRRGDLWRPWGPRGPIGAMETCGDRANPWGHGDIRGLCGHTGTVGTCRDHRGPQGLAGSTKAVGTLEDPWRPWGLVGTHGGPWGLVGTHGGPRGLAGTREGCEDMWGRVEAMGTPGAFSCTWGPVEAVGTRRTHGSCGATEPRRRGGGATRHGGLCRRRRHRLGLPGRRRPSTTPRPRGAGGAVLAASFPPFRLPSAAVRGCMAARPATTPGRVGARAGSFGAEPGAFLRLQRGGSSLRNPSLTSPLRSPPALPGGGGG